MAPHLLETTVAAPPTPILRASVNVERGQAHGPAKVGNCHTISRPEIVTYGDVPRVPQELATGGERFAGGEAAKATRRINHGLALHDETGL